MTLSRPHKIWCEGIYLLNTAACLQSSKDPAMVTPENASWTVHPSCGIKIVLVVYKGTTIDGRTFLGKKMTVAHSEMVSSF